jgi:hypothetical protein
VDSVTEQEKDRRIKRLETLNWTQIVGLVLVIIDRVLVNCT